MKRTKALRYDLALALAQPDLTLRRLVALIWCLIQSNDAVPQRLDAFERQVCEGFQVRSKFLLQPIRPCLQAGASVLRVNNILPQELGFLDQIPGPAWIAGFAITPNSLHDLSPMIARDRKKTPTVRLLMNRPDVPENPERGVPSDPQT
jgi:hypothetical protein